jgi:glycosyltransferase involved in cell wall biosynthesis
MARIIDIDRKLGKLVQNSPENTPVLAGKRLIIVLGSLELGGSEHQALLLARYLTREQSANVQIWGFNPGQVAKLCDEYGIPWRIVPLPWIRNRARRLRNLAEFAWTLWRARPDVLLPYTMIPNVVCGLAWRWTGARLCVWNQRDGGVERVGEKIERWAISRTPWFVSNSQHGAEFMAQTLGARPDRIWVIHNGVELITRNELDRAEWRNWLGVNDNCFLACMIANLSAHKDHTTLLYAWQKVVRRLDTVARRAVLLLAGRFDNTHESLEALARVLGLDSSVRFLGQVDNVPGLLSAIDLGVFSSRLEGCPNGVLECMAAGLAIAGTDIPGIREAVGSDGYPFLAPPGDAETLADRIVTLAMDPELRARLGALNRRRIAMKFSPKRMYEEMVTLLSRGLNQ